MVAVPAALAPVVYGLLNIASATGIVFANKAVFSVFGFHFTYALTLIHTLTTWVGMQGFLRLKMFEPKQVQQRQLLPLAAAYVAYIVLCNLNLNINPVGFYQITKIAVAPAVLAIDYLYYGKKASPRVTASVLVVCLGVGMATITDPQISSNMAGLAAGFGSVGATALYQIWAGSKQKELGLGSMQLLHQYVPLAAMLLGILVPLCEPMGWSSRAAGTILGYTFTPGSVVAIAISSVLGLLVNLSTFLVIGATSSLTYNVVGHVKTVLILSGGVLFFGDTMPPKKMAGIAAAMTGIVWYSQIKLAEARQSAAAKLLPQAVSLNAVANGGSAHGGNGTAVSKSSSSSGGLAAEKMVLIHHIGTAAQQVAAAEQQKASQLKGSGSAPQPEQGKLSIGPKSPRQRRTGALPVLLGGR